YRCAAARDGADARLGPARAPGAGSVARRARGDRGETMSAIMPRRVLYLAWAPFFSGAERALLLTLRSLDPARYAPYVLAGTDGEFATQVRAMGVPCDIITLQPLDRDHPIAGASSIARVLGAARRHRASL